MKTSSRGHLTRWQPRAHFVGWICFLLVVNCRISLFQGKLLVLTPHNGHVPLAGVLTGVRRGKERTTGERRGRERTTGVRA